jgi:hypothetical protein
VAAVQPGARGQVLGELHGLLGIQAQEQGHDDRPQADAALDAAAVDAVAQAHTVDQLRVLLAYRSIVTGVTYRCESAGWGTPARSAR